MTLLANDFVFPNGLRFTGRERDVHHGFRRGLIRAFDVLPNGLLANRPIVFLPTCAVQNPAVPTA